jgi:hypothetical protein
LLELALTAGNRSNTNTCLKKSNLLFLEGGSLKRGGRPFFILRK